MLLFIVYSFRVNHWIQNKNIGFKKLSCYTNTLIALGVTRDWQIEGRTDIVVANAALKHVARQKNE